MVVGKPYIHFTINNEPPEAEVDYTYTWATTVETTKGPVNQPTLISSAAQAQAIFGVDMRPYFAQGAESLIMVRVAASSAYNQPEKGMFSFLTNEDIYVYRAVQSRITEKTPYNFTSYGDAEGTTEYATGSVKETGKTKEVTKDNVVTKYTEVQVLTNSVEDFVNRKFYIVSDAQPGSTIYELFVEENNELVSANIYVTIESNREYIHSLFYVTDAQGKYVIVIPERKENGTIIPEQYISSWNPNGTILVPESSSEDAVRFKAAEVKPYFTPQEYIIPKGTSLFTLTSKYEGDYGITVSIKQSAYNIKNSTIDEEGVYDIILTDPSLGTIKMSHVYDISKIINRINDAGLNFVAKATDAGLAIASAMNTSNTPIELASQGDIANSTVTNDPLITSAIQEGGFITKAKDKEGVFSYLLKSEAEDIDLDKKQGTKNAQKTIVDYAINLITGLNQPLAGSSNGEWDTEKGRIPSAYQGEAHKKGLDLLRRMRIAGVFCMYEEDPIRIAYQQHGIDPIEPEKGMNNNETCKWRTILLPASHDERTSRGTLAQVASSLNDQYTLLLGQGLIDTGVTGIAASLTAAEKVDYGIFNEHQLLPCECTQYIAGLRSKLNYDESIFGGQGRKRIRSVGDLEIAPLFDYEDSYDWDPKTYSYLNEAGVLTFTEEYGNITLTDGVTTCQKGFEEDEEGVMNILKYAQNAVYNVCLPYIGRNINGDLENGITMEIQSVLEEMKTGHQSIVDTDEYPAYTINVSLGARSNQLLGRIYVYLTITPAHALRQIEVEMTVQ